MPIRCAFQDDDDDWYSLPKIDRQVELQQDPLANPVLENNAAEFKEPHQMVMPEVADFQDKPLQRRRKGEEWVVSGSSRVRSRSRELVHGRQEANAEAHDVIEVMGDEIGSEEGSNTDVEECNTELEVRTTRKRTKPERFQAGQDDKRSKASSKERKKKQVQVKKASKNRLPDVTILCFDFCMAFRPPPGMK